jgi:translation elongation factor EF-Tu-like GTPase
VTGYIEKGTVRIGDRLSIVRRASDALRVAYVRVTAIQRFQESLTEASQEHNPVGISLSGVETQDIQNRDVLVGE